MYYVTVVAVLGGGFVHERGIRTLRVLMYYMCEFQQSLTTYNGLFQWKQNINIVFTYHSIISDLK